MPSLGWSDSLLRGPLMADSSPQRLLLLLAAAVGIAIIGITLDVLLERLSEARRRSDRMEAQARTLRQALAPAPDLAGERDALKMEVAQRVAHFYGIDALTPYSFGTLVKTKLISSGMKVHRYQIVEMKGKSFLEFSLSGSARGLLIFLRDVCQQEKLWAIPSMTVATRPGSDVVDVVFRIGYEIIDAKND